MSCREVENTARKVVGYSLAGTLILILVGNLTYLGGLIGDQIYQDFSGNIWNFGMIIPWIAIGLIALLCLWLEEKISFCRDREPHNEHP